ncbi:MAG TPA: SCO family protein [Candidatus Acidoferrales bacterium]|nr:SCO family protein [Candidatus Acidoferrales bacterium]
MKTQLVRGAIGLLAICFAGIASPGAAAEATLRGVVLGIDPQAETVLVHHEAFGGMPSMTMPFSVSRSVLAGLRAGERITGVVDTGSDPWGLREVRIDGVAPLPRYVPVQEVGTILPARPLVDQDAKAFSFQALEREAIVAFIYTRCGDAKMCPLVSAKFARLQSLIDPKRMRLIEMTLDPSFDTPAVLRRYGTAFGADADRWTFVTGSSDVTSELSGRMGVVAQTDPSGILRHSEALLILDPDGRIANRVDGNAWTPQQAVMLAQLALHEHVDPFTRLALALSSGITAICGRGSSGITLAGALALFCLISSAYGLVALRLAQNVDGAGGNQRNRQ